MQNNKKQVKKAEDKVINLVTVDQVKNTAEVVEEKPVKRTIKKEVTTKTTVKKPATKPTAKPIAEKTTSTRKTLKISMYIQHDGKELEDKDIIAKVKEVWVSELGNKISEMKSIITYIKPEEQSIYYVINDEVTGRIDF